MVLNELGSKLSTALKSITDASTIDDQTVDALLKEICTALLTSDVNVRLVQQLRTAIKQSLDWSKVPSVTQRRKLVQQVVYEQLCKLVDPGVEPYKPVKGKCNVFMMVGLQGSGKTTTCTKLAVYYQRKGWKVALVCTDTFRAGAFDQLKQNATRAKIPFYGSYTERDPVQLAMEGVKIFKQDKFDLVIVDTSGRHKQETELFEEMRQIAQVIEPHQILFVMDATIGQAADAQARAFKSAVSIGGIIITKMDGHAKGGGAISGVAATSSPITFIGTGEHLNDLERFSVKGFVNRLLGLGDVDGLLEQVQDFQSQQKDPAALAKKLEQGIFTLGDMYDQLQNLMNMGPMNKLLSMLPGMPPELLAMANDANTAQDTTKRMRRLLAVLDSMTRKELASDGKMFITEPSRVRRVAHGAGVSIQEVEMLLAQHKTFSGMVKTMGGSKGLMRHLAQGQAPPATASNARVQQQMQQQMQRMVDPRMLRQMGGMQGMQQMMRQMMQGGNNNPMAEMMRQMGMNPPGA